MFEMSKKYSYFTILIFTIIFNVVTSTPLWLHRKQNDHKVPQFKALSDYLLTDNILPIHYQIELYPYILTPADRNFTFDGKVIIDISVNKEDTNEIKLHAYDVTISSITVKKIDDGSLINVDSFTIADDDTNFLTINLASNVIVGSEYQIDIDYVGVLNNNLEGFYRSTYNNSAGEQKWMATTHFQANGARRAFPCFDQPDMKATFTINIAREPEHIVLSNMQIVSDGDPVEKPGLENWMWVRFAETKIMSTYIIAFSVNQFDSRTNELDPRFQVWARPDAINQASYANSMAPKAIKFMEYFTNITFMLEKLDQIAIPDFASGAMENWGLVTYRETNLLYEEGKSTSKNKQSVATVVFHELSHQWFGDLVTPEWWNNLWLSEGFATYFEYIATDEFEPTWRLEDQFIYEQMHTVLQSDARESTHPMVANVDDPSSINGIFDDVSYNKGGCIVRMLVTLMGQKAFTQGINSYLTTRDYDDVVPNDLWAGLQTAIPPNTLPDGVDVKTIMNTWVTQSGYPVIYIERNYDEFKMNISQKRFLTLESPGSIYNETWWVPLTLTSADEPDFNNLEVKYWHSGQQLEINDLEISKESWIIFNLKQVGFYRVNYDSANWQLLVDTLNDPDMMSSIHLMNRAQLMDDALALARANDLDYTTALDTTAYLAQESEFLPWASALSALGYLNDRLNYEQESRELFEGYMLVRLENIYNLVNGFTVTEDDSHIMRLKRALILKWACLLGHDICNIEASKLFNEWTSVSDPDIKNPTDPDMKSVVYCTGMQEGGRIEYDFLFERYEAASNVASEQALIITALGCASDTILLEEYLLESIEPNSRIRSQDARNVLTSVYNNRLGVDLALDFLLGKFDILKDIYEGFGVFNRVFSGIAEKLNTEEHKKKLEDFYTENESNLESEVKTAVQTAIKTVDETLEWHKDHRDTVISYLKDNQVNSGLKIKNVSSLLLIFTFFIVILQNYTYIN